MNVVQIENWQDYHRDGEQFLKTADRAHTKKSKAFSNDTLYNITCMAIEKLIMAFLMKNGDLAENHTMGDLARALGYHLDNINDLLEEMTYLDSFQEICDLESYTIRIPTDSDIVQFLQIAQKVRSLVTPFLEENQ